ELSYNINWTDKDNLLATIEEDHILALNFREVNRSEVTVTASDPYGQTISQTFEVNAKRVLNVGETNPDVTLCPNPVAEILTVKTQTELSGSFKLYGIGGRKTAEGQFENGSFTISFCDQQSGVYILKIITENSQKTFRVIKK
ncbi:MAG: T9SS type A sorting domain-containing protein, partial [Cytophagales bacterium]|nr:T9SS type A sorting domain-containing protein [Cytophagales bacterium]